MKNTARPYTFDNFDVRDSNRDAYDKARSFAENDHSRPLLLLGPSWTGKTHLLEAVRSRIAELHPEYCMIRTDDYNVCRMLVRSVNGRDDFAAQLLAADVLLVDEIAAFQGLNQTQQQFIRLLCVLHERGKRIMLTSCKTDTEFDLRLRQEGLICDTAVISAE